MDKEINIHRCIKASMILWTEPPLDLIDGKWHGPYGAFLTRVKPTTSSWLLCCPGCGELGAPKAGAHWQILGGSFEEIDKLTLSPSIAKGCCGWHGYLVNGIFRMNAHIVNKDGTIS